MKDDERHGLLAAGNFIIDHVKIIDAYPEPEMLASILTQSSSNGGGPYNVLKDLSKMGATFPLYALGLIGEDAHGQWILDDCAAHGIDASRLMRTPQAATSYTDAMTVAAGGQRTFFHHRGANAVLSTDQIRVEGCPAKLFYLGYLLLLDSLDAENGRGAARVLERAGEDGMKTIVDFVSTRNESVRAIAASTLPFVDVLFVNEIEAGMILGRSLRRDGGPDWGAAEKASDELLELGVREMVILHFQEGALLRCREGALYRQGCVKVPPEAIRGATGAGDAFAAGMIYALHENWALPEGLELAVCAAAASLGDSTPSGAMVPVEACLERGRVLGYHVI